MHAQLWHACAYLYNFPISVGTSIPVPLYFSNKYYCLWVPIGVVLLWFAIIITIKSNYLTTCMRSGGVQLYSLHHIIIYVHKNKAIKLFVAMYATVIAIILWIINANTCTQQVSTSALRFNCRYASNKRGTWLAEDHKLWLHHNTSCNSPCQSQES